MTTDLTASQRADLKYKARHQKNPLPASTGTMAIDQAASAIIEDFSPDRESIQRVRYVFDRILDTAKTLGVEKDVRYTMMKTFMYESLKDLSRVPDSVILPMVEEFAQALHFVSSGSMAELTAYLEQEENAGDQ
jgi:hypothetical protein